MAHELHEHDTMMSVHETPWHGLGTVLADYPTIDEAKIASGLTWKVEFLPIEYQMNNLIVGMSRRTTFPSARLLKREDTGEALSVVGSRYVPFQNHQMWDFLESFANESQCKIETAGSLRNGRVVWAMLSNGTMEYLSGDPIQKFFLFKNSYTGDKSIEMLFTDVRVVCNNTLTAALRGAKNSFKVKHTKDAETRVKGIQDALGVRAKYNEKLAEAMVLLTHIQMTAEHMREAMDHVLSWTPPKDEEDLLDELMEMADAPSDEQRAEVKQRRNAYKEATLDDIMELVETGAGSDIPGVKGTAYGLLNAATEWSDHYRAVRTGRARSYEEANWESAFMGAGAQFKQRTFNHLTSLT